MKLKDNIFVFLLNKMILVDDVGQEQETVCDERHMCLVKMDG
jgi:hypothetical protein